MTGDHLYALPSCLHEIRQQASQLGYSHLVFQRMSQHRHAAGPGNPGNRGFQSRPVRLNVSGLTTA